jgi:hypothetical protein
MADLQLLQTVITGYAAMLQTFQVWQITRDRPRALAAYRSAIESAESNLAIINQAASLRPIVPQDVADLIERRFNGCWSSYFRILDPSNNKPDEELERAEKEMIKCACREAKRLFDLTGGNIPPGPLLEFWQTHKCWLVNKA